MKSKWLQDLYDIDFMIVIRRDLISAWERHDLGSPKSLFGILFIVDILLAAL